MNILIFLGSSRTSGPPRPKRQGERVSLACSQLLEKAFPGNSIEIIDPLDYDTGGVFKPEFAYSRKRVPQDLETLGSVDPLTISKAFKDSPSQRNAPARD